VLLLEKLLVQENETQPQKLQQEKKPQEEENVKLHQEKVLEEKPQGDLLEGEDARIFSSFFITFDTNCKKENLPNYIINRHQHYNMTSCHVFPYSLLKAVFFVLLDFQQMFFDKYGFFVYKGHSQSLC